jgi:CRP/FNR family transcriptional regulator, cyclic AMP receptor protein
MMAKINFFKRKNDFEYYTKGQKIFAEGQPGKVMYVIAEGEVEILVKGKLIEKVLTGGIVGELGIIDNEPRSATAIAITDCKLIVVDKKRFAFLVQETPNFANQVMKIMARRLRRINEYL